MRRTNKLIICRTHHLQSFYSVSRLLSGQKTVEKGNPHTNLGKTGKKGQLTQTESGEKGIPLYVNLVKTWKNRITFQYRIREKYDIFPIQNQGKKGTPK